MGIEMGIGMGLQRLGGFAGWGKCVNFLRADFLGTQFPLINPAS